MSLKSLRIRLLVMLGALILTTAGAQLFTAFHASLASANRLFDYHMQQMALALQDSSFEQLPLQDRDSSHGFDFVIQIWSDSGSKVYQSRPHRVLPQQAATGYSSVTLFNGEWRIYSVRAQHKVIQVAQQMDARRQRSINIAMRSLWPIWVGALLLLLASWWVVTLALRPVERVRAELAARDGQSLDPVNEAGLPDEIAPLVRDLNGLLARVGNTLAGQQRFIAAAAHEIRSPLTALKLQVQLLARAPDAAARALAEARLAAGTERVIRLAEQLLQMARHEGGEPLAQAAQTADLCACIHSVLDDAAAYAASKQIRLIADCASAAQLPLSPDALTVLVRNLIDNAIRYSPAGAQVAVATGVQDGQVCLTVDDTGPGIAEAEYARVFERFYRISGSNESGSGLGLAIVRTIVDRCGASIRLSRSPLGGLRVSVCWR